MASSVPVNPTALSYLASRVKTLETSTTYKIEHTISESVGDAIDDAYGDYLAILPSIENSSNDFEDVDIPPLVGPGFRPRSNGKTLRFFNDTDATSDKYYNIKDGDFITKLLGQEAISMIWNSTRSAWTCIPGIVNVKSKPSVESPVSSP